MIGPCFAELSEDDVQKIILGETVAEDTPEVSMESFSMLQRSQKAGQTIILRENLAFFDSYEGTTDEEIQILTECTMTALLNGGLERRYF